jgi:hypothetical protein
VKNYLAANRINSNLATVSVVAASDPNQTFNLDDPANELQLFQVRVSIPYSAVTYSPVRHYQQSTLSAALTYRNGRAAVNEQVFPSSASPRKRALVRSEHFP